MCLNNKVIAGLAAAGLAIYLLAPGAVSAALPLLILAACPLSMVAMMWAMKGDKSTAAASPAAAATKGEIERLQAQVAELQARQSPLDDRRG